MEKGRMEIGGANKGWKVWIRLSVGLSLGLSLSPCHVTGNSTQPWGSGGSQP